MRIAERLHRLERAGNADPRMTPVEIKDAAERLKRTLAADYLPAGVTPGQARETWRSLVDHPGSGWRQRVYANMNPMDIWL